MGLFDSASGATIRNVGLTNVHTEHAHRAGRIADCGVTVGPVRSSPAIGPDGTVYVGSNDHKLYAINPDGTVKWSFPTGSSVAYSSSAIGVDGTVYVGSNDTRLYAVNPDGTLKRY